MFSEKCHPELLDVALKGEFLREFLETLKQDVANFSKNKTLKDDPIAALNIEIYQKIIDTLNERLSGEKAQEYGISARELMLVIGTATGLPVTLKDHYDSSLGGYIDKAIEHDIKAEKAKPKEALPVGRPHDRNKIIDAFVEFAAKNQDAGIEFRRRAQKSSSVMINNIFCQCLALQENKQGDYLEAVAVKRAGQLEDEIIATKDIRDLDDTQDHRGYMVKLAGVLLTDYERAKNLKVRGSKLAPLVEESVLGNPKGTSNNQWPALREAASTLYKLNPAKAADNTQINQYVSKALKIASKSRGINLPASMAV